MSRSGLERNACTKSSESNNSSPASVHIKLKSPQQGTKSQTETALMTPPHLAQPAAGNNLHDISMGVTPEKIHETTALTLDQSGHTLQGTNRLHISSRDDSQPMDSPTRNPQPPPHTSAKNNSQHTFEETPDVTPNDEAEAMKTTVPTMSDIGNSLAAINTNLISLNETVLSLKSSNHNLQSDFDKLREEVSTEVQSTKDTLDTKLEEIKEELLQDQVAKSEEFSNIIKERDAAAELKINELHDKVDVHIKITEGFQGSLHDHSHRLNDLENQIKHQNETINEMRETMDLQAVANNQRIVRLQQGVDEARLIANDVEAHGRRWAVHIAGLDKPTTFPESPDHAKDLVVQFITEKLGINSIVPDDLDCAHRIGAVKNDKQAILCRFFRRDLADMVLRVKKQLKGSGTVLFEDATKLNKQLVIDLKARPEVESSWTMGGKVWAKLKGSGKKIKVSINDNLDYRLRHVVIPPQETNLTPDQETVQNTVDETLVKQPQQAGPEPVTA
jgi:hypothetical protein